MKRLIPFLAISLATIALSIIASSYNFLETIENKSWDFRLRLSAQGSAGTDPRIKIIILDQASLDLYANEHGITWPWPRTLYIPVLRYLEAAGARGVAFDIIFSESSVHGVEEDQEFAREIGSSLPTISTIAPGTSVGAGAINRESLTLLKNRLQQENRATQYATKYLSHKKIIQFNSATLPVAEIIEQSSSFGSAWAAPDRDGVFRHYWPGGYLEDLPILSLSLAFYNATVQEEIENFNTLLDDRGRLTVRFHGRQNSYETIPIANVISSYVLHTDQQSEAKPIVPLDTFKDAWVFVGVWAPGLLDLRPSPLDEVYKGVEYHATVFDNLLNRDLVRKVPALFNILYSAIFIFLITGVVFFIRTHLLQLMLYLTIPVLFLYCGYFFTLQNYWLEMVVPLMSGTSALIAALGFQYYSEGRERRFIKNAFSHYVSPGLIQKILEDPSSLSLGGEKRELTIFFSDLAGFTTISEALPADKLVLLLNRYLTAMTDILLESGATLDKYEGDAIIAFWNAPVNIKDHPFRAVKAALDCQQKLTELRGPFKEEFGVDLFMRIGLHTGVVNVGNFGSQDRFDYTVIGDAANLAARLEGVNKVFETSILISESTKQALGDRIYCRKLGAIRVVGRKEAINVFEPLIADNIKLSQLEKFKDALELFERGLLEQAERVFREIPEDQVATVYIKRIRQELEKKDRGEWSAVWNLISK